VKLLHSNDAPTPKFQDPKQETSQSDIQSSYNYQQNHATSLTGSRWAVALKTYTFCFISLWSVVLDAKNTVNASDFLISKYGIALFSTAHRFHFE
jgi:hypothetical protein